MKIRQLFLLLLVSSTMHAKYDVSMNTIRVYGVKDYTGAFMETFLGSVGLLYSAVIYAAVPRSTTVSGATKLVCGLGALGSSAAIVDGIRRAFASADVMLEISPDGILCKNAGLVSWKDVLKVEGMSYTTIQFGRPFNSGYRINIETNENAIPVEIDGSSLSESLNTVLTFVRKYYKGTMDIKRETVQDSTPRPTNVNVNQGKDDSLVKLVNLGVDFFGKK